MKIIPPAQFKPVIFTGVISILNTSAANCNYVRMGKYALMNFYFSWATAESFSTIEITLPLTIDTTYIPNTTAQRQVVGSPFIYHDPAGGTTPFIMIPRYKNSTTISMHCVKVPGGASTIVYASLTGASDPVGAANGTFLTGQLFLPIVGWGS